VLEITDHSLASNDFHSDTNDMKCNLNIPLKKDKSSVAHSDVVIYEAALASFVIDQAYIR